MFLIPLTNEPLQQQNFTHDGYDLTLITRWNSVMSMWNFDLYNNITQSWLTRSEPLSVGSPALNHLDLPFVFVMLDSSGVGYGSSSINDMGNRITVNILSKDEYNEAIR